MKKYAQTQKEETPYMNDRQWEHMGVCYREGVKKSDNTVRKLTGDKNCIGIILAVFL